MNVLAYKQVELLNSIAMLDLKQAENILINIKSFKPICRKKSLFGIWKDAHIDCESFETELKILRDNAAVSLERIQL